MSVSKNYIEEFAMSDKFKEMLKSMVPAFFMNLALTILSYVQQHSLQTINRNLDKNLTDKMIKIIGDPKILVYLSAGALPNAHTEGLTPTLYYNKLLQKMLTQKEMYAVLCHEYGHFKEYHIYKRVLGGLVIGVGLSTLITYLQRESKGVFKIVMQLAAALLPGAVVKLLLSQPEEYVADSYAAKYRLGNELGNALHKLELFQRQAMCVNPNSPVCDMLLKQSPEVSTHPDIKKRIERLRYSKEVAAAVQNKNPSFTEKIGNLFKRKAVEEIKK